MKWNWFILSAAIVTVGQFFIRTACAADVVYEPRIVARSGDVFGNRVAVQFRQPDINNHGEYVIEAYTSLGEIVVASNGIQVFSRDFIDGNRLITMNSVHINDAGNVYFSAQYTDTEGNSRAGFFRHDEPIALRGDVTGGYTIANLTEGLFPVNASGEIAFIAPFSGVGGATGTTALVATQNRVIVAGGDVIDGAEIGSLWDAAINDDGDVVFYASSPDVGEGIFTTSELLVSPGMTLDGRLLTEIHRPAINNRDDLAAVADYFGGTGVFVNGDQVAATGQTIDGRLITEIQTFAPAMNNHGDVAFLAFYNGGQGIFTPTQQILAYGETLEGIRVGGIFEPRINDRGQIITTFWELNSENMYVAIFTPVPEPSGSTIVIGLSALLLLRGRGRRLLAYRQ